MEIFDLDLERYVLAGILRHPDKFADIDGYLEESDFKSRIHQTIWGVVRQTLLAGEKLDKFGVATKIDRISLKFEDNISSVSDYIEELILIPTPEHAVTTNAEELKTVSLRDNIADTASDIIEAMQKLNHKSAEEVVSVSDKIYTRVINSFTPKNEPVDLFKGAEDYINSLDNDAPSDEILSPYPFYQRFFGGYFPGDLVIFASAAKSGKSTLLLDMMIKMSQNSESRVKGLIIDTELETYRVQRRMVAAIAGVNEYLIKSKKWRDLPEMADRVRSALDQIKKYFDKVDHIYIGNVSTDEMVSIVKRWHWKKIDKKRDKPLIAIDYFKLTGADKITDAFQSSMSLGYRVDTFKKLASELQCPVVSACQTNRANEVGLSHEVNKFASSVFLFQRKTKQEFVNDGKEATHNLVPLYTRDLGEYAQGVNDIVKVPDGRGGSMWAENCLQFKLDNFKVSEVGDLRTQHAALQKMDIAKRPSSVELE